MNQPEFKHVSPAPATAIIHTIATLQSRPLDFKCVTEGWLMKNLNLWDRFYHATERLRMAGRDRGSAKWVMENLRWNTSVKDSCSTFRLNNNVTSGLARLYNAVTNTEFFEVRQ